MEYSWTLFIGIIKIPSYNHDLSVSEHELKTYGRSRRPIENEPEIVETCEDHRIPVRVSSSEFLPLLPTSEHGHYRTHRSCTDVEVVKLNEEWEAEIQKLQEAEKVAMEQADG